MDSHAVTPRANRRSAVAKRTGLRETDYLRQIIPRPRTRILSHVGAWSYIWFVPLLIAMVISWEAGSGLEWLAAIGKGVSESLDWAISTIVSVLLAFYAVSIGGQLLQVEKLASTRNILGVVGAAIGAATLLLATLVIAYASTSPETWGQVVSLVPVTAIILFLVLHLGFQMNVSREKRRDELLNETARLSGAVTDLDRLLQRRSSRGRIAPWLAWTLPTLLGLLFAAGTLAVAGWLLAVDNDGVWDFVAPWIPWLLASAPLMLLLTGLAWLALRYRFRELPGSKAAAYLMLYALWGSTVAILSALLVTIGSVDSMVDVLLLATTVGWLVALAVASWPMRWTLPRAMPATIAELEASRARRMFTARIKAIGAELPQLAVADDDSTERGGLIRGAFSRAFRQ